MANFTKNSALIVLVLLLLIETAQAGGLNYHHHWSVDIGNHTYSISEIEDAGRPGVRFTRVRIRERGRDFQCGIWTFSAIAVLIPVVGTAVFALVMQRRRKQGE